MNLNSFEEKDTHLYMAQQSACRVWTQLPAQRSKITCRTWEWQQWIQNANNSKFPLTALSSRYDMKIQEMCTASWAIPLPKSATAQAGPQTIHILLVMPPSANVPLITVPAMGRDTGLQQRNNNQDEHCSWDSPLMFAWLNALLWLMLEKIEGIVWCFW